MDLECEDGTFGDVATMDIGGHKLLCGFPDVSDVLAVFFARFIVWDLMVYDMVAGLKAGHDAGVGWETVAVFVCL